MRTVIAALIAFLLSLPAGALAESIRWEPRGNPTEIDLLNTADFPSDPLRREMLKSGIPADTWRDPSTGMEFVWVPGGCFEMGQSPAERLWLVEEMGQKDYDKYLTDELPRHAVCVDGFWMGKYEVTRGQFRQFVEATGYRTKAEKIGKLRVLNQSTKWKWEEKSGHSWRNVGFEQTDDHPVAGLDWDDTRAFLSWMHGVSGGSFRLPTEAEWEFAARAGSDASWFWGDDPSEACRYGNGADKTSFPGDSWRYWVHRFGCTDGHWGTAPVGSYRPNGYGLYDMMGNVWERCEDWYGEKAYATLPKDNPVCRDRSSGKRIVRGGGWNAKPRSTRSSTRGADPADLRNSCVGFRVVRLPGK